MKTYVYETTTCVGSDALYRTLTSIRSWPEWDRDIEWTEHDGNLSAGAPFTLKPRGGPKVSMTIVEARAPRRFVDIAHLPLGKMRTSHELTEGADGTRLRVVIEVWGPLRFLWDRVVARKQAAGAAAQVAKMIAFAHQSAK